MMASSGYVAEVDRILCVVCATRKDACPFEVIQGDGIAVANWEACIVGVSTKSGKDHPSSLKSTLPKTQETVYITIGNYRGANDLTSWK
jgi:hypothetical protein